MDYIRGIDTLSLEFRPTISIHCTFLATLGKYRIISSTRTARVRPPDLGMIVAKVLNFFLCTFGFSSSMGTSVTYLIRGVFVLSNLLSLVNGFIYFHDAPMYLPALSNLHSAVHDAVIYTWRVRLGGLNKIVKHRKSMPFLLASGILVFANVGLLFSTIVFLVEESPEISVFSNFYYDKALLTVTEIGQAIAQLQRFIVFWELAIEVEEAVQDVEIIPFAQSESRDLERACRCIKLKCAFLSRKFSLPLVLMYTGYFLNLVTDIPVEMGRLECTGVVPYHVFKNIKHLFELLIVVRAGNALTGKSRNLVRELRKRPDFFKNQSSESKLFTRFDHTISFGIGCHLNFRSVVCFLGLSWSFTLATFQSNFQSGTVNCSRSFSGREDP